jgi:hypothetical protein
MLSCPLFGPVGTGHLPANGAYLRLAISFRWRQRLPVLAEISRVTVTA